MMKKRTRDVCSKRLLPTVTVVRTGLPVEKQALVGQNPRAIQQAMGHSNLETTMGYLHAEAMSVRSPLDAVF